MSERNALVEIAAIIATVKPHQLMSTERAIAVVLEKAGLLSRDGDAFITLFRHGDVPPPPIWEHRPQ